MPVFVRQLDGSPNAGDNCGPASVASALRWSTEHDVAPSPSGVRAKIGDLSGGTRPSDLATGWEGYRGKATKAGWDLSKMVYRPAADFEKLVALLRDGGGAVLAVKYAEVPLALSGDPFFDGPQDFHAVFAAAIRERSGKVEAKIFDPLCDGRRPGIPGPGAVWWPIGVLRRATGGYAGDGKATYNAVRRSKRVAPEVPCDPSVVASYEAKVAELNATIRRLDDAVATATTALSDIAASLSHTRDIAEEALAAIRSDMPGAGTDPEAKATRGLLP